MIQRTRFDNPIGLIKPDPKPFRCIKYGMTIRVCKMTNCEYYKRCINGREIEV